MFNASEPNALLCSKGDKRQVELENYGTQPVLLQSIKREAVR